MVGRGFRMVGWGGQGVGGLGGGGGWLDVGGWGQWEGCMVWGVGVCASGL